MPKDLMSRYDGKVERLSAFLKKIGHPIGYNNTQHAVAIVEGHNDWQSFRAFVAKQQFAGQAKETQAPAVASPKLDDFEQIVYNRGQARPELFRGTDPTLILGEPGSGKAAMVSEFFRTTPLKGGVIIDEGGSYRSLCEELGGRYVEVSFGDEPGLIEFGDLRDLAALSHRQTRLLTSFFEGLVPPAAARVHADAADAISVAVLAALHEGSDPLPFAVHKSLQGSASQVATAIGASMEAWGAKGRYASVFKTRNPGCAPFSAFSEKLTVFDIRPLLARMPQDQALACVMTMAGMRALSLPQGKAGPLVIDLSGHPMAKSQVQASLLPEILTAYSITLNPSIVVSEHAADWYGSRLMNICRRFVALPSGKSERAATAHLLSLDEAIMDRLEVVPEGFLSYAVVEYDESGARHCFRRALQPPDRE